MDTMHLEEHMNRYHTLSIGTKILTGFLVVACVAIICGVYSTGVIWEVTKRGSLMYTSNIVPISDLTDAVNGYQTSRYLLRDILIDQSPQEQNVHLEKLKQINDRVDKSLAAFIRSNHSPEAVALHKQITDDLKLYDSFRQKTIELAMSGRRDEAANIERNVASDVVDRIDGNIAKIVALNKTQALARYTNNSTSARMALYVNIMLLIIGAMGSLIVGYILSRGITRTLTQLSDAVESIAEGNLTATVAANYPPDSRNELHLFARNIDRMADTLRSVITRIANDSRELTSASGRLNHTIESMVQSAEGASAQIHTVSASSEEMNQTASEIARNCSTAAGNVSQAHDGITQGQHLMTESINSMQRIGDHVRETSKVIAQLGQKSVQIEEITSTIDSIADQTNLLALNAAIEAARAGEHGRGFAVVADEVRALASRTTAATREISAMIQAIQSETNRAIAAMGNSVGEVEEGTKMMVRTGNALQTITESICLISSEVGQIATAAEEQSASIFEISTNIQRVTVTIAENADGTQEFATAASGLDTMATDLRSMVGKFRLEQELSYGVNYEEPSREILYPGLAPLPA